MTKNGCYLSWTSPNGTEFEPGGHPRRSPLCREEADARRLDPPVPPNPEDNGADKTRVGVWEVRETSGFPVRVFLGWQTEDSATLHKDEGAYETHTLVRIGSQYFLTHEHYGRKGGDPKRKPEPTRRLEVGEARAWLLEQGVDRETVAELVR
jgi:hypothetical protein